jgi:hypothetical protein
MIMGANSRRDDSMKKLGAALVLLLALAAPALAHALDAYLQAALIAVDKNRIQISLRLVPGVAVLPQVLAQMDADGDGAISAAEQRAYAAQVLGDVSFSLDGHRLTPRLLSVAFPTLDLMRQGLGEIRLELAADVPQGGSAPGAPHRLIFENHHQSRIAAYLVNALVPADPAIRLIAQHRSPDQSFYQLDYSQGGGIAAASADSGGFSSMFRLGLRHIAEGTDHLMFLLALLLPAPLMARAGRWAEGAGLRHSLFAIVRVVTAFTLGHSLTLALAGFGLVSAPARPIEVLIAVSILVSAAHALRPLFPGREAVIAGGFGLIHGLAFAATLGLLGLSPWQRLTAIAGFNLGIEAMQLVVIAATLPSLLLLSRTPAYGPLRTLGALAAGLAALAWIGERLLGLTLPLDRTVNAIAGQAPLLAASLFLLGLACRARQARIVRS